MLHIFKMECKEGACAAVALSPELFLTRTQLIEIADHRHWTCGLKVSIAVAGPFEVVGSGRVFIDQCMVGECAKDAIAKIPTFNRRHEHAEVVFKDDIEKCTVKVVAPELYEMRNGSVLGLMIVTLTCIAKTADKKSSEALVKVRFDVSDFKTSGVAFGSYGIMEPGELTPTRVVNGAAEP